MTIAALLLLQLAGQVPPAIEVRAPARPSAQVAATVLVEPVAMMIAAFDSDGDGLTSRTEMETGVRRSFAAIDTGGTGQLRYIAFADWAERFLGDRNALPSPFEVDRNGDDIVSLAELEDQFGKLFSRFDQNHDGAISRKECLTFRTAPVGANGPTTGGRGRKKRPADTTGARPVPGGKGPP